MDVGVAHPKHPRGRGGMPCQAVDGLQLVSADFKVAAVQIKRDELPIVR
mgnify:CR=1 FL=1